MNFIIIEFDFGVVTKSDSEHVTPIKNTSFVGIIAENTKDAMEVFNNVAKPHIYAELRKFFSDIIFYESRVLAEVYDDTPCVYFVGVGTQHILTFNTVVYQKDKEPKILSEILKLDIGQMLR